MKNAEYLFILEETVLPGNMADVQEYSAHAIIKKYTAVTVAGNRNAGCYAIENTPQKLCILLPK